MALDLYLFCMALGFFGLVTMLVLGFGHGAAGHAHGGHVGHAAPGHHAGGTSSHDSPAQQALLMLLTPRVWFSLLFGFGAAGYLLRHWISGLFLGLVAAGCAWVFERWLVETVWNFVIQFASNPAKTLESTVLEDAVAVTNFDAEGEGLISVNLDGQIRQMLGTLHREPGGIESRVLAGDKLTIIAVNTRRNQCTVAKAAPHFDQNTGTH